jgi:hypothetical protein
MDQQAAELERLEAEERYTRDRLALYRAKAYGPRATDPARMRELELAAHRAAERLATARRRHGREGDGGESPPGSDHSSRG